MIKLKARNTVVIACPSGLSDVVGHRPDGTPIVKARELYVYAGETFEIDAVNAERLLEADAATRDLSYQSPRAEAADDQESGNVGF